MSNYSADMLNSMFINGMDSEAHVKKAATMFSGYIRDVLRDVQFSRKILPARAIGPRDDGMQRSTTNDGLVFMDELEPESSAMALTWTGHPTARYIVPKRYEIGFFQIGSDKYQYTEQELLASRYPIHKIIEDNVVKDIGTIEDLRFLILCELALAATGQIVKGTATNAGVPSGDIIIDDIINAKNLIIDERRPAPVMLINDVDYNKILKWTADDVGFTKKGELVFGDYSPDNILKTKVVRTAKTNLLRQGNIYFFSSPEFLGRFLVLGTTKFFLKKERDVISWESWEFLGMSIANAWSVSKLEIYSGASQALPAESDLFTSRITAPPVVYPTVVQR